MCFGQSFVFSAFCTKIPPKILQADFEVMKHNFQQCIE